MYLDIFLAVILLLFFISGIKLGFFVEFISIFGLIGNFFIAGYLTPIAVNYFRQFYSAATYTRGYIIIFAILYFILMIITNYVNLIFRGKEKGFLTRATGGLLGILKGITICIIIMSIYILGISVYPNLKNYSNGSYAVEWYDGIEDKILDHMPQYIKDKTKSLREEIKLEKYLEKIL